MFNSIKAALCVNAFRNFQSKMIAGGHGSFSVKGLKIDFKKTQFEIGSLALEYNFPLASCEIKEGDISYVSETESKVKLVITNLKASENGGDVEIEEISIESIQDIKELLLHLPLEEMAELAVLESSETDLEKDGKIWVRKEKLIAANEELAEVKEELKSLKETAL